MLLKVTRWIVGIFCVAIVGLFAFFVAAIIIDKNKSRENEGEQFAARLQSRMTSITDERARVVILNRVTLGQAARCNIDKDEVLSLMTLTSAMIAAFTGSNAEAEAVGDDAFKMGVDMQKNGSGASCSSVADGVQKIREYAQSQGLR